MRGTAAQEAFYGSDRDYLSGSPHLKHPGLNRFLLEQIFSAVDSAHALGLPLDVLEVGAGDGSVTEPLLARGYSVTSTDMSEASVERMTRRFSHNDRFRGIYDRDGSLDVLGERRFGTVLFASVLHHIPDYVAAIRSAVAGHLLPGGALVSIQDPLWYSRLRPGVYRLSNLSYASWRLFQGDLIQGVASRLRRSVSGPSEDRPNDMVEYHVVRDGVDELAVRSCLQEDFDDVEVIPYWSSHGAPQQRLGEILRVQNTFAVRATGYRPQAG